MPGPATYACVAKAGFRRYATYRAATYAGVFTNTVFGCIICFTYLALWHQRPHLGGWDARDAVTFVWIGQALLMTTAVFGGGFNDEMAERIRTGDIAVDLFRPVDLQGLRLAEDLGRALFHLLGRGIAPALAGAVLFTLRWPQHLVTWVWFAVAVVLGVVVSFAIRYLVALAAFWVVDVRGFQQLVGFAAVFFSGLVLPLVVFPGALQHVARALPFAAMVQVPGDVFLEKSTGAALALLLAQQVGWAAALLAAGRLLSRRAMRHLVVQGG